MTEQGGAVICMLTPCLQASADAHVLLLALLLLVLLLSASGCCCCAQARLQPADVSSSSVGLLRQGSILQHVLVHRVWLLQLLAALGGSKS
jgi:hypothetical protein